MDLVFEIGCEELPAGSLKPALEWMAAEMSRALDDARLNGEGEGEGQRANISKYATPRRLALVVTAIAERAPDVKKTVQGPPAKAAFQDGKPTKAAEGFARKVGVPVSALRVEGDRVVVEQELRGQSAAEALPGILERLVRGIPFKKSMRWDSLDKDAFARPVHWIAAMLDGKPLPVAFADVKSGSTTTTCWRPSPAWSRSPSPWQGTSRRASSSCRPRYWSPRCAGTKSTSRSATRRRSVSCPRSSPCPTRASRIPRCQIGRA